MLTWIMPCNPFLGILHFFDVRSREKTYFSIVLFASPPSGRICKIIVKKYLNSGVKYEQNRTEILLDPAKTNAPRAKLKFKWLKQFISNI